MARAASPREVLLYATGTTYIADVFARGELDDDYRHGRSRSTRVAGPHADVSAVEARLLDPHGSTVLAAPLERGATGHTLRLPIRSPRRWSAEDPTLYTLVVSLRGAADRESVACRVGFRRVEIARRACSSTARPCGSAASTATTTTTRVDGPSRAS